MHSSMRAPFTFLLLCVTLGDAQDQGTCEAAGACVPDGESGEDTSSLLQTGAAQAAGADVCPSDVGAEATSFWKDFFKTHCKVDWDVDVPDSYKDDIGSSVSSFESDSGANGCHIETLLSDVGGRISFMTLPPAADADPPVVPGTATDEGWSGQSASAARHMNEHGHVMSKHGEGVCDIFGDGVPRLVDIPSAKVDEVFQQVQKDYGRDCGSTQHLILATDTSIGPVVGKRSMSDSSGKSQYTFVLSVSAPGKDAVDVQVWAEEDVTLDSDSSISAANDAFEEQIKQDAELEDAKGEEKGGATLLDTEGADVASYIQGRVHLESFVAGQGPGHDAKVAAAKKKAEDEQAAAEHFDAAEKAAAQKAAAEGGAGDSGEMSDDPAGSKGGAATSEPVTVLGYFRVLDDRTTPLLCCLCDKCANKDACTLGAEGLAPSPSFIEDDDVESKIREQERLYPELAPNLLLQVETARLGSKAEHYAPPSPGDVVTQSDFRIRAEPGYGDNFHSSVLPQRTAEDHKLVWAQSRALIESVKAEKVTIPDSYHFYDSQETAGCFQAAYNQGKCGSCWAFASLGAIEKQICLRSRGQVRASLSREMLVRCSEQNNGCQGGNADKAYEDLMEIGGVFSTDCLPYQGKGSKHCPVFAYSWFGQGSAGKTGKFARIDQELQKSCADHTRYSNRPPQGHEWDMPFRMMYEARFGRLPDMDDPRLQRFRRNFAKTRSRDRVPSWWLYGEEAMKASVTKYGSVYASFKVRDDFKGRKCPDGCWPPGTVYGEEAGFKPATCGCGKGHAVHIIGFGEDIQETGTKVPYWLIENSWGKDTHGDIFGEDAAGVKGFGKDPFTEEHPMGIEDKCLLAGWAYSSLPRTGGCGGNANVNIRKDVPMSGGKPDGMHLSVMVDGVGKGNWSIAKDSSSKFSLTLDVKPGPHKVKFMIYANDHPKQQGFDVETYGITATSLRCRGKGYRYSFTQNDTKANLSWGRKTRKELKAEADALIPKQSDPTYLYAGCPTACRTGRYSWVKPCLGLLTTWGSCYTDSWALRSSYMQQRKKAMCTNCSEMNIRLAQKAYAIKNLPNATFLKWFSLVEQSFTAPDDPGWMRSNTGSCVLKTGGFVQNALLSATYDIDMPNNKFCDERHSAPYAKGKFVHAPGYMKDGDKTSQRCPPPLLGNVSLHCRGGALYALSNTCSLRPNAPVSMESSMGYYKTLRGANYHGIESGAAFAIAEMNRFASNCPTLSWSRWSECNVTTPCARGVQHRSRKPIGLDMSDPKCAGMMFHDERTCVGPGFCPQVLTRFVASGSTDIGSFMRAYKTQSTTIDDKSYATAGAHMLPTSNPTCDDAKYWCKITTGKEACDMYMEGHFKVEKDAEYFLHYETTSGGGVLEFNTLGEGSETKPQYQIRGGTSSSMFEWQDLGFHHRRRRSGSKPWERISSLKLSKGTYYARMTRGGWSSCPTYQLRLEQLSAVYRAPLLLGTRATAAAMTKGAKNFVFTEMQQQKLESTSDPEGQGELPDAEKQNVLQAITTSSTPPLINLGGSGCKASAQCTACKGDCDSDADCAPGFTCFQRSGHTPVPGCAAGGVGDIKDYDYCISKVAYGNRQKTTTWWNNWGAVPSHLLNYRGRYSSYAPLKETGSVNEIVLRDQGGKRVIKKTPINKFKFTAEELYKLTGINRFELPSSITRYNRYELLLRSTIILPEQGDYIFKFQIDTSFNSSAQAWQQSNRRRNTKFQMRVGANPSNGKGASLATFSAYQGSATKSVSFKADKAGTVPFEVSILTWYNAPGDKMTLPNFVEMEVKRRDMLHGNSLEIGSQTKYMSDLAAIRGDTLVRIDWPERDDPLSSELKTQTFETLDPQALLIGNKNVEGGFQALAEAKIDAGACTSLEAWVSGVPKDAPFQGVGLNLCDVDGDSQFLELVTYHPPKPEHAKLTNISKVRVGWVHIGFTQPTHMRITRDPLDLKKFEFAYKPDNRLRFATPFKPLETKYTGTMDVGVSMSSPEAYRYAEFYNVSFEECPSSCSDASGKQLWCGDFVTPCGNKVKCKSTCGSGDLCRDNMCMTCPALNLSPTEMQWECGTIRQHCQNHKGQKIQVHRDVGKKAQPSSLHFCTKDHTWTCVGKSKWAFLAEGKECGKVMDNCNNNVTLFDCPMPNDVCQSHKCKCYPTTFAQDYNCGSEADGCGKDVVFGSGTCPGAYDRCQNHKCCTPKKKKDFDAAYQCGSEADGCEGHTHFSRVPASPFFKKAPFSTTGYYHTGQVGIEFVAATDAKVVALARGLQTGKSKLSQTSKVTLWDVEKKALVASVDVGPDATTRANYAWADLQSPVGITKGKAYRLTFKSWRNMKDRYANGYLYGSNLASSFDNDFATLKGRVLASSSTGYPEFTRVQRGYGVGTVNFDAILNDGCGSGLWTCHANHSCTKQIIKGFTVKSGPCVLASGGNCVTSKGFPNHYGNRENCVIQSPSEGTMKTESFNTESGFDWITLDGKRYQGTNGPPVQKLSASKVFNWRSDGSVTRPGWKICMQTSLLEEPEEGRGHSGDVVEAEGEQQDDTFDDEEAPDNLDLAELSEEERGHALAKYQRLREEAGAVAEERQSAETDADTAETEPAAMMDDSEEVDADSDELVLDEDEAALPDLTEQSGA